MKRLGRFRDPDLTEKFVYEDDKGIIETTWIRNKEGVDVFCVPTHYYCTLGCKFCHLTDEGAKGKTMGKISPDTLLGCLDDAISCTEDEDRLLISIMGVGEPFLNVRLVNELYCKMHEKLDSTKYKSLAMAVATMMPTIKPVDYLIESVLSNKIPLKLHFSLHSPIDEIRKDIIPCANVSVEDALASLYWFREATKGIYESDEFHLIPDPTELHYTVIEGVNDSNAELDELIRLGNAYKIPVKILKFNPTDQLKRSTKEMQWFDRLSSEYSASVSFYEPPGTEIGSSCGQFTKHYYLGSKSPEENKEFLEWKRKHEVLD